MKRFVLIDFSWCLYRNYFAPVGMTANVRGKEIPIGQMYLFGQNAESMYKWDPNITLIYCKDSPPQEGEVVPREAVFEGYKKSRTFNEDVYRYTSDLEEILCALPYVRFAKAPGKESDDVMAQLFFSLKEKYPDCEVIVFCGDNDLLQLMEYGARIARAFNKGEFEFIGQSYIDDKFNGIPLQYLLRYRCLIGDSSDEIPGLWPRMNREKAKAFAISWAKNGLDLALRDATIDYMFLDKIKACREALVRNVQLMNLVKYRKAELRFPLSIYRVSGSLERIHEFNLNKFSRFVRSFDANQHHA